MSVAGHCVSIDGEQWHEPGQCRGAVEGCDGKCCAPVPDDPATENGHE